MYNEWCVVRCELPKEVWAIYIASGEMEQITGAHEFQWPTGLALDEMDRVLYMSNRQNHQIVSVELPDRFFVSAPLKQTLKPSADMRRIAAPPPASATTQ